VKSGKRAHLRRFVRLCKPYWGLFLLVVGAALLQRGLALAFPPLAGWVMDDVIADESALPTEQRLRILWRVGSALVAVALVSGIVLFVRGNLLGKLLWRVIFDLRQQLNWHLQRLSLSFYSRQHTGRLVSRLISDINQASALVSGGAVNLLLDILSTVAIIVMLWRINAQLTWLSLILLPAYAMAFRTLNPRIRRASKDVQKHVAIMSGNIQEKLSGIAVIKSFCGERLEHEQFEADNEAYTQKVLQRRNLNLTMKSISQTITLLSRGIPLVMGGYLALSGKVTPGNVLAFILLVNQVYGPLGRLSEINVQIQQAWGGLERVFDLLDITPEIRNQADAIKQLPGDGRVVFDEVSFGYTPERPVLRDLSFELAPGVKMAVIGPSGAGKSTLASLVPRLYDVSQGRILIDGTDVRQIHLRTLRRMIGVVQQEPFLFSTSIKENILYGRREARMDEIVAAAQAANAHDFIEALPDKYDSLLGERGLNLSVGQRQRICLARTILKNPRVLILDEATSSLDSESENQVQAAMEELMKGRTSIIIAHRLSTIMGADAVIVLADGRIIQQGTHTELWQQGQLYKLLLEQQFGPLQELVEMSQNS